MPSRPAPDVVGRRVGGVLAAVVLAHGLWLAFAWGGTRATNVASDLFQVAVLWAAVAWAWRSAARAGQARLAWGLLAAGMASWAVATTYWSYSEIVEDTLLPVPSAADGFWLLYPVLATAAFLVAALRGRSKAQVAVAALDTVLTATGLFLIVWTVLLEDVWAAATGSPVVLAITLAYPLGDVAVVTAALAFLFRLHPDDRRRAWALPVGAALVALGNLNLSWSYLHAGFQSGSISDVLWTAGLTAVAYGVHRATLVPPRPVHSFATLYEQALPYLMAVAALGFVAWHFLRERHLAFVEGTVALLWTLAFLVRQFLFLRHAVDVQRRLEQAQALAGIGSWEWTGRGLRLSPMAHALATGAPAPTDTQVATLAEAFPALPAGDRAALRDDLGRLLASGEPVDRRVRAAVDGGGTRHLHVKGRGSPARGTVQDVTRDVEEQERRQREEKAMGEVARLTELNKLKTQFINMAAHELNTPLTPIKFALASLKAPSRAPDSEAILRKETLPILERNVERLARLLKDILDAARIQSARPQLKARPMDLAAMVHDIADEMAPTFEAAQQRLAVVAMATPVRADPSRLHEVCLNLLSNASKFTPAGGEVTIRVGPVGRVGRVDVTDTGVGLAQSDMALLFQPFTQVGDQAVKTQQGTGLGLYLAKGIVERHDGRIWAESPGPGRGSTFAFEVPLAVEPLASAETVSSTPSQTL